MKIQLFRWDRKCGGAISRKIFSDCWRYDLTQHGWYDFAQRYRKPLKWQSFYMHDLASLVQSTPEVRKVSVRHKLGKSKIRSLQRLNRVSRREREGTAKLFPWNEQSAFSHSLPPASASLKPLILAPKTLGYTAEINHTTYAEINQATHPQQSVFEEGFYPAVIYTIWYPAAMRCIRREGKSLR